MNKLTRFSLKNVAAVIVLACLLVLGGSYAATTLKVESMPDITFPFVAVNTVYPAPPNDVVEQVTKPIENAIAGLDGIYNMVSYSTDNFSQVFMQLEQRMNPEEFKKEVESALASVRLPQGADKPRVFTEGFSSSPVYYMAVFAKEGMTQEQLDDIYNDTLQPAMLGLKGVDHIDSIGNREAGLSIRLDAEALNKYGFTPSQVSNFIRASMASSPAGSVDVDGHTQMVRIKGELSTVTNLEKMKLATPQGLIELKELGSIESVYDAKFNARLDGRPAIAVHLYKTKSTNQVEFAADINNLLDGWKTSQPDIEVQTVYDGAEEIKGSLEGMMREGILGAILASIMILLFLRNVRMTLIVLVSIPLSILSSLLLMSAFDISLNIMTLGGLAISVGRVVDDSIVVIENIFSHLQRAQKRGEPVIRFATKQVASAITSSTLTTVGVFGPIAFVTGVVGEVFVPFALTLVCALLASLIVALTVIPVLAKLIVMNSRSIKHHDGKPGKITGGYRKLLVWSLNHWIITLSIAAVMLVGSVALATQLPQAFMPESESDQSVNFSFSLPRETSFETTDAVSKQVEELLANAKADNGDPLFKFVEALVGYSWGDEKFAYRTNYLAEVNVGNDAKEVVNKYKDVILALLPPDSRVHGQVISIGPPSETSNTFIYSLRGDDLDQLKIASALVRDKMLGFPELSDVQESLADAKKELEIVVDQEKAMSYGLTSYQVIESVNGWIGKQQLGELKLDGLHYKTVVELDNEDKNSAGKIASLPMQTALGTSVKIGDIASVREVDGPNTIEREMQEQVIRISAKIEAADKKGAVDNVSAALSEIKLPKGVSTEIKGVSDDIDKSFREMFVAMFASVFIVYLIMIIAFGNATAPFAILFSLPLAAIGGLLGLYVTGESVNVTSLIGFLMLIGIVVTNAIVLVDRVQQLRHAGNSVRDSLVEAGMTRLRPIIMTAGATIMTLLPIAFGMSKGALVSKGLAVVVIGGLTTSTLLTLVIVPIAYERLAWIVGKLSRRERSATSVRQAA